MNNIFQRFFNAIGNIGKDNYEGMSKTIKIETSNKLNEKITITYNNITNIILTLHINHDEIIGPFPDFNFTGTMINENTEIALCSNESETIFVKIKDITLELLKGIHSDHENKQIQNEKDSKNNKDNITYQQNEKDSKENNKKNITHHTGQIVDNPYAKILNNKNKGTNHIKKDQNTEYNPVVENPYAEILNKQNKDQNSNQNSNLRNLGNRETDQNQQYNQGSNLRNLGNRENPQKKRYEKGGSNLCNLNNRENPQKKRHEKGGSKLCKS